MSTWLRQLRMMTGKELRQLWRDRSLAIFIAYIFTLDIVIAAGASSHDVRDVRVVVHDADRTSASRELIHALQPPYFTVVGDVTDADMGLRLVDAGDAMIVLDIPPGFQRTLTAGAEPARVQVFIDTSRAIRGYLAASQIAGIAERMSATIGAARVGRRSTPVAVALESRVWYNGDLNPTWFLTISELLTMMTVACIVLPGAALVREKERGTIEQLLVSPLSPFQVMLPKILAMVLVTVVGTAVAVTLVMRPIYGVPVRGSLSLLLVMAGLYAFINAGLGLAAATFVRSSAQLGMVLMLLITPIIMLSGTWVTVESMPPVLRLATNLSPLRHFIQVAYGIFLRGSDLTVLWPSVVAMTLLGAALFGLGVWRFRRQFVG